MDCLVALQCLSRGGRGDDERFGMTLSWPRPRCKQGDSLDIAPGESQNGRSPNLALPEPDAYQIGITLSRLN